MTTIILGPYASIGRDFVRYEYPNGPHFARIEFEYAHGYSFALNHFTKFEDAKIYADEWMRRHDFIICDTIEEAEKWALLI